ncbi:hypothetical protein KIL84_003643 [Mauremys mutica]|uniref:Uncharacterized protein n=1 Tax=Mauremys mutica TaxID=74926 RepID=A0A9D3WWH2_9SAUR|nr:hypothetical protein KIL84_003643 [Mauremys mutica]
MRLLDKSHHKSRILIFIIKWGGVQSVCMRSSFSTFLTIWSMKTLFSFFVVLTLHIWIRDEKPNYSEPSLEGCLRLNDQLITLARRNIMGSHNTASQYQF